MVHSQDYPVIRFRCQFKGYDIQNKHRNDGIWIWSSQMTAISICLCARHFKGAKRALNKKIRSAIKSQTI